MKRTVWAYLHTHWDREWYRNKEDFNIRLLDVFDVVIDELINNRAPFFYFDGQVAALLDYLKYREENTETVKKLIKENKLAIGPYFVSADSYLINFRSMLKNLELGIKISKEFGQKNNYIGYMSDIFGISNSAFKALEYFGIDKAIVWRGVNPKKIENNCNFIKNGIKTLWLVQGYFNDFFHSGNVEGINNYLDKIAKYSFGDIMLPIGADHLGILKNANEKIKEINKKLKNYKIILSNPLEYFKHTEFQNNTKEDEFLDNSDTYILQGVYSARIDQKTRNALIQNELTRIIEPLNFYLKDKYEKNIDFAYKTLIKNYAHDGIYGCSVDSVHKSIDARLDKCENIINSLKRCLIEDFKLKYNISSKPKDKIGLFNLSNSKNIKTVKIKSPYIMKNAQVLSKERNFPDELYYDIYKIPVTEEICDIYTQLVEVGKNESFSFSVQKVKIPAKKVKISNNSIENDFIKLTYSKEKLKIFDKKQKKSFEIKLTDIKDKGDSYNFAPKGEIKEIIPDRAEILYKGDIESCLRIFYKNITLDIKLNSHSRFLNFECNISNKKKNHKIQLAIVSNKNISKTVSDDAFGIIKRKIDYDYNIKDHMPAERPKELKTNCYPMQSFVCANDVIVFTKGLNEYEIYKNELKICLLRAFSTISNPKNPTRAIPAGPDLKTETSQMLGDKKAYFALLFGDYKKAYEYIDEFMENYAAFCGEFRKDFEIKFEKIEANSFIYGISEGKKISYNI